MYLVQCTSCASWTFYTLCFIHPVLCISCAIGHLVPCTPCAMYVVPYILCDMYTLCRIRPVQCTPCAMYSLRYVHLVLYTPCAMYTLWSVHLVLCTLSAWCNLYPVLHIIICAIYSLYTLCALFALHTQHTLYLCRQWSKQSGKSDQYWDWNKVGKTVYQIQFTGYTLVELLSRLCIITYCYCSLRCCCCCCCCWAP